MTTNEDAIAKILAIIDKERSRYKVAVALAAFLEDENKKAGVIALKRLSNRMKGILKNGADTSPAQVRLEVDKQIDKLIVKYGGAPRDNLKELK